MNDSEFENELRCLLRPAGSSTDLRSRIERDLNAPVPRLRISGSSLFVRLVRDLSWAGAGAAAALVALTFIPTGHTSAAPKSVSSTSVAQAEPDTFEREESSNELLTAEDSDQLVETNDGPAREVHYNYRERHEWSNPHTGARVVLEVPREDVYLMPVSLQ